MTNVKTISNPLAVFTNMGMRVAFRMTNVRFILVAFIFIARSGIVRSALSARRNSLGVGAVALFVFLSGAAGAEVVAAYFFASAARGRAVGVG